jgi:indole-3-glycerol phosphate synthase/phosphoribosylanthranilate isomerase
VAEPQGILGEIVRRKRADVAERLGETSLADLRAQARPTGRSLAAALETPGARFIMEVKRASPSAGAIRAGADPRSVARAYGPAADAISVLTDTPYFGGSLADLAAVREAYDGPILCKDFMIDPRQVPEARLHGADAILVMLSVLGDEEARAMLAEAERLGMDSLVEAHDEEEVRRAVALGARIVGINNRDLGTLNVDLATTERLAPLIPSDRVVVSESGIASRSDAERLAPHADAFLVGSSLMAAEDPAAAARALAFGRVKLCGVTNRDDLRLAARSGASFAGLILVPGTPRAVSLAEAEAVAAGAELPLVGVFRNAAVQTVKDAAERLDLAAVQLHGEEDEDYIASLRGLLPERTEIWAAAPVADCVPPPRAGADRTLFDTAVNGRSGGTGAPFDWSLIEGREEVSSAVLAGGLNPANVRSAARIGAYALDVCSGVEAQPGRKDPARVAALFESARLPARGEAVSC